ncbi:primosomal protein N' [Silvimonas iriomotensis]|uniref:Replication restart protein PriA n=1 Tax=Silvimonas iriomotensis TaxID=449662 RepID=A0ABQ2P5B5_9NEIS|nr:primosomal protein N' [Silvimonas iriomotensis]GGP18432.1 primosomal protein N' [Silvimonas iriomotensis]
MPEVYLQVALDVPLQRTFDYRFEGESPIAGLRVIVPFGRQLLCGVIVQVNSEFAGTAGLKVEQLKLVQEVLYDMPPLPRNVLALCRFCSDYYAWPLGQVISAALPGAFRQPQAWQGGKELAWYAAADAARLTEHIPARAHRQHELARLLAAPRSLDEIRAVSPSATAWLKAWLEQELVSEVDAPMPTHGAPVTPALPELTEEQRTALEQLNSAKGFAPFLLFGVTGSGKTEVYLRAIEQRLAAGGQVLVLIPEINLTPQLEARFKARFPQEMMVSLHSGLADGERTRNWLLAAQGRARIVLGTRLAVFAPMPDLALIVVDEEHDLSYRQQEGFRYSARDVAVYRAHQAGVPIILGSATPSMESWRNMRESRYRLLTLKQRAVTGARPPQIQLLSTQQLRLFDGLTQNAINAMRDTLGQGGQVLVFVNRRGYAPVLACHECGWIASCKRCTARLVLHREDRRLRCHHCGWESPPPTHCPDCGNADLQPLGFGTQRLEEALTGLFPDTPPLRIDRDNTRRKGSLDAMLQQIHKGEARLLVGTQMMAKGHDFANLQLVVVLNADAGLFSLDFRAQERLYALLLQVAGRAGRAGQPGKVLIQTRYHDDPFYPMLISGDYAAFADRTLQERKATALPPFSTWAMLRAEAKTLQRAMTFLREVRERWRGFPGLQLAQPVPALMVRKAGWERAQVLISAQRRPALQAALREMLEQLGTEKHPGVRWALDVDPVDV